MPTPYYTPKRLPSHDTRNHGSAGMFQGFVRSLASKIVGPNKHEDQSIKGGWHDELTDPTDDTSPMKKIWTPLTGSSGNRTDLTDRLNLAHDTSEQQHDVDRADKQADLDFQDKKALEHLKAEHDFRMQGDDHNAELQHKNALDTINQKANIDKQAQSDKEFSLGSDSAILEQDKFDREQGITPTPRSIAMQGRMISNGVEFGNNIKEGLPKAQNINLEAESERPYIPALTSGRANFDLGKLALGANQNSSMLNTRIEHPELVESDNEANLGKQDVENKHIAANTDAITDANKAADFEKVVSKDGKITVFRNRKTGEGSYNEVKEKYKIGADGKPDMTQPPEQYLDHATINADGTRTYDDGRKYDNQGRFILPEKVGADKNKEWTGGAAITKSPSINNDGSSIPAAIPPKDENIDLSDLGD